MYGNYTDIPDLVTTCDINDRAFFYNQGIGWFFEDEPLLTFAVFSDSLEVIAEFIKVIDSISFPGLSLKCYTRIFLL